MLPGLVFFSIFRYIPLYGVTLALKDFVAADGILGSTWVGLKYFNRLFTYPGVGRVPGVHEHRGDQPAASADRVPAPIILALISTSCARASSSERCRRSPASLLPVARSLGPRRFP